MDGCLNKTISINQTEECEFARALLSLRNDRQRKHKANDYVKDFLKHVLYNPDMANIEEFWKFVAATGDRTVQQQKDLAFESPYRRWDERLAKGKYFFSPLTLPHSPLMDIIDVYAYFFEVFGKSSDEKLDLLPLKKLSQYKNSFKTFQIAGNKDVDNFFSKFSNFLNKEGGTPYYQIHEDVQQKALDELKRVANINQTWIDLANGKWQLVLDIISLVSDSPWLDQSIESKYQKLARKLCPVYTDEKNPSSLLDVCQINRGNCSQYCKLIDELRSMEKQLVGIIHSSVQPVSKDRELLRFPISKRGRDGSPKSQFWTQVITDRGICYSSYSGIHYYTVHSGKEKLTTVF